MNCYVIIAGRDGYDDTDMSAVLANSPGDAHYEAAVQYRLNRDLETSVEIVTHTAVICDTPEEAREFIRKVHEGLLEAE